MISPVRRAFPYAAILLIVAATVWAVSFKTWTPASFTFINGTEPASLDPALVSGAPEGRIIDGLFEGLYRVEPSFGDLEIDPDVPPAERAYVDMVPKPGVAESHTLSDDKLTYTFKLRPDAKWSDGTRVTAHDFEFSWKRFLHPETGSKYEYQLTSYVENAGKYFNGEPEAGERVEVELADRVRPAQLFPRGTILYGTLKQMIEGPKPKLSKNATKEEEDRAKADQKKQRIYVVRIKGKDVRYSKKPPTDAPDVIECEHVLFDWREVGANALDDSTFEVKLKNPTPYFLYLAAFYPLYPVNRNCVETHGVPDWTDQDKIVSNGPYVLEARRIRDRIRLKKSPTYWNQSAVSLETIDALAVESSTTSLNMYLDYQVDWAIAPPNSVIDELKKRGDTVFSAGQVVYFYRFNVNHPPLDNVLVRRALNMALDKRLLVDAVLRAGQKPATSIVPPGLPGYKGSGGEEFDPLRAKQLLTEAGYEDTSDLPTIEILYNNQQGHRTIAEFILSQWQKNLGVTASLKQQEWSTYLESIDQQEYVVARAGWIGDYPDPNTFLDMWITDGANNQTGWSNERYDELLLKLAPREGDPKKRYQRLREAEQLLMEEVPIMPIYFYVNTNMVRPYVKGWYPNAQDSHPLTSMSIDEELKQAYLKGPLDPVTGLLIEDVSTKSQTQAAPDREERP